MQTRLKNRKSQILDLALELLQTRGFENFSYHDLATELGVSKANIHHHFPKKEDLGVALCERIQQWHEDTYRRVRATRGDAWSKLDMYFDILRHYADGRNKVCPLSSLQADIASLPASMQPALKALDVHELSFVAELLEQGRGEQCMDFPGSADDQAALMILAAKAGLQYSRVHGPTLFERTLEQCKRLLSTSV